MSHRLTTLLDMYKFDAAAYHHAVVVLTQAIWICVKAGPDVEFVALDGKSAAVMIANLETLASVLGPLNVPVTKIAISEFETRLRAQKVAEYPVHFHNAQKSLTDISETLRRELKATSVFVLDSAKASYYEMASPLFGHEVATKFPTLAYDIAEAGKCLALDRSTAAAFHSIRALEGGITAMSRCLSIPDPTKGAERNWGSMLGRIDAEIKRRWNSAARMQGDGHTFEGLHGALSGMQNPYRNATMHFDQVYTSEDAKHVFDLVGGILRKIASRMDENGLSLA